MTKSLPKVAVVTRTKDRPIFLRRALQSVAKQTYKDYVHIVVNDGGNQDLVEDLVSKSENNRQIRVFHRDTASNAPDAIFNESIDRIESDYFAVHDDDDSWHPDFLKETVARMEQMDSLGAVVVRTDKIIESLSGEKIKELRRSWWMEDLKVINLYRQCIDNQLTPISTLFRRDAYKKVGKFDVSLPVVGDWEFGIRLLMHYDAEFINPGYPLAYYHHRAYKANRQGNTSFAGNDNHRYYTNLIMNRYLREELQEGRLGAGYMMNQMKYTQSSTTAMLKKVLPKSIVDKLKQRVAS
jgi:glycosyltransferase involved in cell wall biosynthesis